MTDPNIAIHARGLIHDPAILFLDEPFSGLDVEGTRWLCRLLDELRARQRTVCFAVHDRGLVRRLADTVLELQSGQVHEYEIAALKPDDSGFNAEGRAA